MYGWNMQWDKAVPSTLFYYDTKKWVMWLVRDVCVEPEITVRNFGPATSELAFRINHRTADLRRNWSGGNT